MSISQSIPLRKFKYNKIDDNKLEEGRISIPFSLLFTNANDNSTITLPTGLIAAQVFTLNARQVQGVQNFSAFKSISFTAIFTAYNPGPLVWGSVFLFAPDSGDIHEITPLVAPAVLNVDGSIVNGSIPIITNNSSLIIAATPSSNAGSYIQFSGIANNFEQRPWLTSAHIN